MSKKTGSRRWALLGSVGVIGLCAGLFIWKSEGPVKKGFFSLTTGVSSLFSASSKGLEEIAFARNDSDYVQKRLPNPTLSFSEFAGKPLVIVLWRIGCAPCLQELTLINRLEPDLKKEGVVVLPILVDSQWGRVVSFLTHINRRSQNNETRTWETLFPNLPPYYDAGFQVAEHLEITSVPAVILFNKKHQETHRYTGVVELDLPERMAEMRKHLGLPEKPVKTPASSGPASDIPAPGVSAAQEPGEATKP